MTEKEPIASADALYNAGNTLFKQDKIEESIEAYKETLRLNPKDHDARYNLQLAKEKLKQQQQNQQQNPQQQNRDQQNKDQQQKNQNENKQQEQQPQNQQQDSQQQQQPRQAEQNKIPKEQADRILEALRNNEKEIQKQIRKREGTKIRTEKDW